MNGMKFISDKSRKNAEPKKKKADGAPKKAPEKNKPAKGGGKKALVIAGAALAVLIIAFIILGVYAQGLDTVYPKVSMEGIDLSDMTIDQAAEALSAAEAFQEDATKILTVELPAGLEMKISAREAGLWLSAPDAAAYAYDRCRSGGFVGSTITYLRCLLGGLELNASDGAELDEEYLEALVDSSVKEVRLALMDMDADIGEDSVTVVKGASAVTVDAKDLYKVVSAALKEGKYDDLDYNAVVSSEQVEQLDVDWLYDVIFQEPVNAVYDPETNGPTQSQDGRSFDKELAKSLWDKASMGDSVVIPLILTPPEVSTEELSELLFSQVLAQKSTTLGGSSSARVNNITKAAAAINGLVINPGGDFSYNGTLGQRTLQAGYLGAGAYSGGKVVTEVGGGICQVSSTLYYCTLIANLEILDRTCHWFGVDYLPAGLDATVSWPSPDFKFKNNSDYPIKIEAYVDSSAYCLVVRLHGCNPEGIRVELTTETWQTSDGYGAVSYRWVYDKDGNLISKTEEARSQYHYHVEEEEEPVESPEPSQEVQESPSVTDEPVVPPETEEPTVSLEPTAPPETEQPTPPPATAPVEPTPTPPPPPPPEDPPEA